MFYTTLTANAESVDLASNLSSLNSDLLKAVEDLIEAMIKKPTSSARELEHVIAVQDNMQYLCNQLRVIQGRSALRHILTERVKEKQELLKSLRERSDAVASEMIHCAKELSNENNA